MSVVLLTKPTAEGKALASALIAEGVPLSVVIFEARAKSLSIGGYIGSLALKVANRFSVGKEERLLLRYEYALRQRADEVLMKHLSHARHAELTGCPVAYVSSVNDSDSIGRIESVHPDLIMVFGTSILKPPVIRLPKLGCINVHTSLLPEYRGARSEFWQCYYQDYTHVGITFHVVDTGVDTGGVIFQKSQDVGSDIGDPFMLRVNNTLLVLETAAAVIKRALASGIHTSPQGVSKTPVFRYRDISREKRLELLRRLHHLSHGASSRVRLHPPLFR